MYKKRIWIVVSVLVVALLALSACANPTEAPVVTEPPATEAPAEPEAPTQTEAPAATEAPTAEPFMIGLLMVHRLNCAHDDALRTCG